ncbi:MAG: flavodoxin family protein, partial [Muribaculaceae bacterium]|nr:flavodoxin family protein [Muribaculaceae bacterium]
MRVLIINSSPRRDGNISGMLTHAAAVAKDAGAECDVISLYDRDIRPCRGCMACRSALACPIHDDMASIAEAIKSADRIIIGAPCYWASMPGVLKNMFDRLVYIFIADGKHGLPRPLLKGRRALVIATATTPMPFAR